MNSSNKSLYSILSLLPLLFFVIYIGMFVFLMMDFFSRINEFEDGHPEEFIFSNFGAILITGILFAMVALAAMIVFIIHAINNKSLPDNERIVWILVFVFAGVVGFPIYWFMRGIKYNSADYAVNQPGT